MNTKGYPKKKQITGIQPKGFTKKVGLGIASCEGQISDG